MKKGFTLVELLIYMGLMTVFIGILGDMFVSILDVQLSTQATSAIEEDSRFIFARLMYDINRAEAIVAPALGETDSSLSLTIGGVSFVYTGDGRVILTENGVPEPLTTDDVVVSNFSVTRLGNPGEKNSLQVGFTFSSQDETHDYLTTVALR